MQYFLVIVTLLLFAVPVFTWQNAHAEGGVKTAVFGGGCFWCMEPPFEQLEGVIDVTAGYSGGEEKDPSYELVSSGLSSHIESVQVVYDPKKISFKQLLDTFWRQIDPTDAGGQFADRGEHYRTAIFYSNEEEKSIAEESKKELAAAGVFERPIVTGVVAATTFYPAEEYHQDYYKKNVSHYTAYKTGSGRSGFLKNTWGDEQGGKTEKKYTRPSDADLKQKLTPLQYDVVVNDATEPAFNNKYWDNKQAGIYVDVASGEPLFSSLDKYKSGTGWPSFTRPLVEENIVEKKDRKFFTVRTEARSTHGDSHLGHIFEDGPEPTGLRYCINSASLDFIAVDKLDELGYGSFSPLFKKDR